MRRESSAARHEIHPQLAHSRLESWGLSPDPGVMNPEVRIGNPDLGLGIPVDWLIGYPMGVGYPALELTP